MWVKMQHYPNRLQQLFIVELPPQLRWVLATLKPILQPQTKEKIRTISMSDPALPLPENVLLSPRFEGKEEEVEIFALLLPHLLPSQQFSTVLNSVVKSWSPLCRQRLWLLLHTKSKLVRRLKDMWLLKCPSQGPCRLKACACKISRT